MLRLLPSCGAIALRRFQRVQLRTFSQTTVSVEASLTTPVEAEVEGVPLEEVPLEGVPLEGVPSEVKLDPVATISNVIAGKFEPLVRLRQACARLSPKQFAQIFETLATENTQNTMNKKDMKKLYSVLIENGPNLALFSISELVTIANNIPSKETMLGNLHTGFLSQLLAAVVLQREALTPSDFTKLLKGLRTALEFVSHNRVLPSPAIFSLCDTMKGKVDNFQPGEIALTLWALENLQQYHDAFLLNLCDRVVVLLPNLGWREIASILNSLSQLRLFHPVVPLLLENSLRFTGIPKQLRTKKTTDVMSAKHVIKILEAVVYFDLDNHSAVQKLCGSFDMPVIAAMSQADTVKLFSALVSLCVQYPSQQYLQSLVNMTWRHVWDLPLHNLALFHKERLLQAREVFLLLHPETTLTLPEALHVTESQEDTRRGSTLNAEVVAMLEGLGVEFVPNYQIGHFRTDMAILSEKICIEVEGPNQFLKQAEQDKHIRTTKQKSGRCRLKYYALRAAGWKVLELPFFDFSPLEFPARLSYLRLRFAGLSPTMQFANEDKTAQPTTAKA